MRIVIVLLGLVSVSCSSLMSPTTPTSSSTSSPSRQSVVVLTTNSGTSYTLTYESFSFSLSNSTTTSFSIRRTDCSSISISKGTLENLRVQGRSSNSCLSDRSTDYVYDVLYTGGSTSGWGPEFTGAGGNSVDDGRRIFVRIQDLSTVDVRR